MGPSVYIETSVIGYLTSWPRQNVTVAGHQNTTKLWWSTAGEQFDRFVSQLVIQECSQGDAQASAERLACLEGIPVLPLTVASEMLAVALIEGKAVPQHQPNDALHIALAATHGVQYLVSWNFRHIVNASLRQAIERICRENDYVPPIICTPEELLESDDD